MKEKIWILVADNGVARILTTDFSDPRKKLKEISRIEHPESHLRNQDLVSDKAGRTFGKLGVGQHAMPKSVSPKDQEELRFAHDLAQFLKESEERGDFDQLHLSAPPKFLGKLRAVLTDNVKHKIVSELNKDLTHSSDQDIYEHLEQPIVRILS